MCKDETKIKKTEGSKMASAELGQLERVLMPSNAPRTRHSSFIIIIWPIYLDSLDRRLSPRLARECCWMMVQCYCCCCY